MSVMMTQNDHDEEKRTFHAAFFNAIQAWDSVEHGLSLLLSVLLTGKMSDGGTSYVFWAVENFRSKLSVVSSVSTGRLGESEYANRWQKIEKHCSKRSSKRNSLVHASAVYDPMAAPGKRHYLFPRFHDPKSHKKNASKAQMLTTLALEDAAQEFAGLFHQIIGLTTDLEKAMAAQKDKLPK